jgi:hypothetical protein
MLWPQNVLDTPALDPLGMLACHGLFVATVVQLHVVACADQGLIAITFSRSGVRSNTELRSPRCRFPPLLQRGADVRLNYARRHRFSRRIHPVARMSRIQPNDQR